MNLVHRTGFFAGLSNPDPAYWGFTHTQVAVDPFTPGDADAAVAWVNGQQHDLKLLLAFTPKPDNALFCGSSLPNRMRYWYDTYRAGMAGLRDRLGARVVGTRFNHEWRPSLFAPSAEWEAWLLNHNSAMLQYIVRYQRPKWNQLLEDTKVKIHPVSFLEQTSGTDWDKPTYADFRTTFRLWCRFQCEREAVVLNRLSAIAAEFGLPFYLYPGGRATQSPRLLPELEYTLDQTQISPTTILEAGGWNTRPTDWINEVAGSIRQPFLWTNQLGINFLGADPLREFRDRLNSRNALGESPRGLGFWCDWTADFVRQTPRCQEYMDGVRAVLREVSV